MEGVRASSPGNDLSSFCISQTIVGPAFRPWNSYTVLDNRGRVIEIEVKLGPIRPNPGTSEIQ
jgi:hypothetical protein